LQFSVYVFQFCWGIQSAQGLHWIIFPGEWLGELSMVHEAHLFLLQFHAGSFRACLQGEMMPLFSVQRNIGRLSMG
jgi:hypothetical protein